MGAPDPPRPRGGDPRRTAEGSSSGQKRGAHHDRETPEQRPRAAARVRSGGIRAPRGPLVRAEPADPPRAAGAPHLVPGTTSPDRTGSRPADGARPGALGPTRTRSTRGTAGAWRAAGTTGAVTAGSCRASPARRPGLAASTPPPRQRPTSATTTAGTTSRPTPATRRERDDPRPVAARVAATAAGRAPARVNRIGLPRIRVHSCTVTRTADDQLPRGFPVRRFLAISHPDKGVRSYISDRPRTTIAEPDGGLCGPVRGMRGPRSHQHRSRSPAAR
jgi:hypothetical protein